MVWAHKSLPSVSYSQYRTGQWALLGTSYTARMPIVSEKYQFQESPQKTTLGQSPHFMDFVRLGVCVCVCMYLSI